MIAFPFDLPYSTSSFVNSRQIKLLTNFTFSENIICSFSSRECTPKHTSLYIKRNFFQGDYSQATHAFHGTCKPPCHTLTTRAHTSSLISRKHDISIREHQKLTIIIFMASFIAAFIVDLIIVAAFPCFYGRRRRWKSSSGEGQYTHASTYAIENYEYYIHNDAM